MARGDYNIFKNLPNNENYGQYYSSDGLNSEEWHEVTGLASIEDVTFGLVNFGVFTGNDLYATQEWLFDSRRLPLGMTAYFDGWYEWGYNDNYPFNYLYGLGGYCLGETLSYCGLSSMGDNTSSEASKNLLWKINNKLG